MREVTKSWPFCFPETPDLWHPLADVYRTRNGWLVKFDLAGVRLEDVTVSIRGRRLTIDGIRKDTVFEEGSTYYSMEISYSRFERTIELPVSLDHARVSLEALNGILVVRMINEGNPHVR
jgi:HSP20 family protein